MKKFFKTEDDYKVFYDFCAVKDSSICLFLVHGMCEHHGRYKSFIQKLHKSGISTIAIDLRGHGLSSGRRGDIVSIEKCMKDVFDIANAVKKEHEFLKTGIFGHSIGGEISLLACSQWPKLFDFCVVTNPVVYLPEKVNFLKFLPFKNNPLISVKKSVSETPKMLEKSLKDPLAANVFNLRTANQVFFKGVKLLKEIRQRLKCPLLLCRGGKDTLLTNTQEFEEFLSSIKSKKKDYYFYEKANHRIVQNAGSGKHIEDIILWIKQLIKTN